MPNKPEYVEHSCSCDKCKNMCKKQVCLGTPEDMLRISKAGFADKLSESYWGVGLMNKTHEHVVPIIAPIMTENGCSFLDKNGFCTLHDLGLKPTEGKLTNNHQVIVLKTLEEVFASPNYSVIGDWDKKDYQNIKRRIFKR